MSTTSHLFTVNYGVGERDGYPPRIYLVEDYGVIHAVIFGEVNIPTLPYKKLRLDSNLHLF